MLLPTRTPPALAVFVALAAVTGCSEYGLQRFDDPDLATDDPTAPGGDDDGQPVADAGPDRTVAPLDRIRLDSTGSYDPQGLDIVAVRWTAVSAPAGSTSRLSDDRDPRPDLFVDLAGDYVFDLTVKNEDGVWDDSPDRVRITAVPTDGFYVQLAWDAPNDLDLHLMDGASPLFSGGDCSYCNLTPSWGAAGRADDPSLDWDAIFGFGPETITIDAPSSPTYHVAVHYYGEEGFPECQGPCAPAHATVQVWIGGALTATFDGDFAEQGELWDVATIDLPSGAVHPIDVLARTNRVVCR